MDGTEHIRERAHQIWEAEGRPDGRDVDHWNQAQQEMGAAPAPKGIAPELARADADLGANGYPDAVTEPSGDAIAAAEEVAAAPRSRAKPATPRRRNT